jgi:hypothetical protein
MHKPCPDCHTPLFIKYYFWQKDLKQKLSMHKNQFKLVAIVLLAILLVMTQIPLLTAPQKVFASNPQGYLRLDRMAISTSGIGGTVCYKPSGSVTVDNVNVTFPSNTYYTLNTTGGNYTIDTTSIPTGTTVWPGMGSPTVSVVGQVLTVTGSSQSLSSANTYCLHWSGASTVTSTAQAATNSLTGTIVSKNGGATVDSINYAIATVTSDQITVTGTLSSIFSLSIGSTTQSLTLDPTAVAASAGDVVTISTNAGNGWNAWVTDTRNGALHSTTTGQDVIAVNTYANCPAACSLDSTTGFGLDVDSTTGSPTIDTRYNGTNGTNQVGTLQNVLEAIATKSTPGAGDQVTLTFKAKPAATVPAGTDYQDVVTVVGAGNF